MKIRYLIFILACVVLYSCTKIKEPTKPAELSATATLTATENSTGTQTVTVTATHTQTASESATHTATATVTPTHTATSTPTQLIIVIEAVSGYRQWSDGSYACSCAEYLSPSAPYCYAGVTGDGPYKIQIGTDIIRVWCDMTRQGGGWTLVLLNSPYVTPPQPSWAELVNEENISGSMTSGLNSFDQFLGVKYWNSLGSTLMLEAGSSANNISHRASYTFTLDAANSFRIFLSDESILINAGGTASPGLYTYSNGAKLSSRDADNDARSAGNCCTLYGNTAWWNLNCWSGSFWGGGTSGSLQNAAYWSGATTEYFAWGAMWVR